MSNTINEIQRELDILMENGNEPIGSYAWKIRDEQVQKDLRKFLTDSLNRIQSETEKRVRKETGIEFWKWFYSVDSPSSEVIEDAIERITGVKYMTEKQFKKKYGIQETEGK